MGNTGINRGKGNKGKSPSHRHISFPAKKLPPTQEIMLECIKQDEDKNKRKNNLMSYNVPESGK